MSDDLNQDIAKLIEGTESHTRQSLGPNQSRFLSCTGHPLTDL